MQRWGDCFYQAGELNQSFQGLGHSLLFPRSWEAILYCPHLMTPRLLTQGHILSKEALSRWHRLDYSAGETLTATSLKHKSVPLSPWRLNLSSLPGQIELNLDSCSVAKHHRDAYCMQHARPRVSSPTPWEGACITADDLDTL